VNSAGGGVNGSVNGADSGVKGSVNGAGSGVNGSVNGVAGDGEWVAVETAGEGVKRAHHCGGVVGDSDDRAGALLVFSGHYHIMIFRYAFDSSWPLTISGLRTLETQL
jgi:hypothetical protein